MRDQPAITQMIHRWQGGDEEALRQLTPFIYDELKRLAQRYMRRERAGHTLQATALVNEAFMQLAGAEANYQSRAHFLVVAARMMRRTLVDHARARNSQKRGAGALKLTLNEEIVSADSSLTDIVELDFALTKLAENDTNLATVIELIFFGGLTYEEAADCLGVSRSSVYDDLRFAKAWLKREMQ